MMSSFPKKPRILCLDGGGIRGLSEILILKELMLQVQIQNNLDHRPEPIECFDFICGTSTGGIIAVMLGRLGKTLDECETLFRTFGEKIFEKKQGWRWMSTGSKHTSKNLADIIYGEAGADIMYEPDTHEKGHIPVCEIKKPDGSWKNLTD